MNQQTLKILRLNYQQTTKAIKQLEDAIKKAKGNKREFRKLIEQQKREIKKHYNQEN